LGLAGLTYPESYADELQGELLSLGQIDQFARERIFPFEHYALTTDRDRQVIYSVLWQDRAYFQVARSLIQAEALSLYAVYFEGADVLSHHFWRYRTRPDDIGDWEKLVMPEGYRGHARVVDKYYRVLDEYFGALLEELPRDATVIVVSDHGFKDDPSHPGKADHSPFGVLIARGPGISPSKNLNLRTWSSAWEMIGRRTKVLDVLPTLLYLHGLPVSEELEGAVLEDLISRDFLERHPIRRVESYGALAGAGASPGEVDNATQEEYEKRLRSLGYLN
jgi:predicted AlkP superfamily phosphohydrolase/phosphomutase